MDVAPWCYKRVDGMGLDMGIFGWGGVYIEQIWSIDYRGERYYRSGIVSLILALFGKYRISRYQGNLARFYTIFLV